MCYSAQITASYYRFVRRFGATLSLGDFVRIYWHRTQEAKLKIPRVMDAIFAEPATDEEREIKRQIDEHDARLVVELEQELFRQRKRLADAERTLQTKTTKAATESQRIASTKIERAMTKLQGLKSHTLSDEDARIFPGWYAPVMVLDKGRRVIKPMRYQCRPEGKPASYDAKFPGTYNARRDNLEGSFWKPLFGRKHGILVVDAFFENVAREGSDGSKQNVVLEFRPRPRHEMLVACLWSCWAGPDGEELLSFAAITDDPPSEVAAAGHDRCIVPIKEEQLDSWLAPAGKPLSELYAILDDRDRPFYEHRLAA
ncbi:MAG: SOS response-associated peptidase family protein [Burkholderiales bacterium]|nr:SOS response-associated peptidase family protein [Burkholderiales bacterium]